MTNCKDELLKHSGERVIWCAILEVVRSFECGSYIKLYIDHTPADLVAFLNELGMDDPVLFIASGTVWYEDGSWSRWTYHDGIGYWEHLAFPDFACVTPDNLKD